MQPLIIVPYMHTGKKKCGMEKVILFTSFGATLYIESSRLSYNNQNLYCQHVVKLETSITQILSVTRL